MNANGFQNALAISCSGMGNDSDIGVRVPIFLMQTNVQIVRKPSMHLYMYDCFYTFPH